jgi:DNA polymerase-3 subunit epsilon
VNLLIVDTETTGLDPNKSKLIEVAGVLYNVEEKVVTQTVSTFLPCHENQAEHINHIKAGWTMLHMARVAALDFFFALSECADLIVAHNAPFDRNFLKLANLPDTFHSKPWMCTKDNFHWPCRLERKRLQDVCQAMGVPYVEAHRALNDCRLLVQCFNKVEDLSERIAAWTARRSRF